MKIFYHLILLILSQFILESMSLCASNQVRDLSTDICQTFCPSHTFISYQGSENVCAYQRPIENQIRPTPDRLSFVLILNNLDSTDYTKTLNGIYFLHLTLDFGFKTSKLTAQSGYFITFLDAQKSTLEITLHPKAVQYYPATLIIEFPDTSNDNQTSYYFLHQKLPIGLLPFKEFNVDEENFLDFSSAFRLPSEIIWCAIGLFSPYQVAYFYGKLYMQTFHLIKMSNVTFSPLMLEYFHHQSFKNKISGLKIPNFLSLILYNYPLTSGWGPTYENDFTKEAQDRKEDLMMMADNSRKILEFDTFSSFVDNMGSEISLIVIIAVLIAIFELIFFFFLSGEGEPGTFYKIFSKMRIFLRYNFLLATILGAFPSLLFYGVHQIRLFFIYGSKFGHNLVNSILAIVCCAILIGGLPVFLYKNIKTIHRIKKLTPDYDDDLDYDEVSKLRMYGILHHYHKNGIRKPYPAFIFVFLIKSTLLPMCILFLGEYPIIQTSLMTAFSLTTLALTIVFRPHKKIYFNVFLIGFEAIELIVLIILTVLAANQKGGFFVDIRSSMFNTLNFTLLIFWMLIPVWTSILGLCSLVEKVIQYLRKRNKNQEPKQAFSFRKSCKVVPIVSSPQSPQAETQNTQRFEENKKLIGIQINDSNVGSTNTLLQFGSQTPRLDSTLIGSTTSRNLIPDVKTDEGENFVFSSAAARRRRIQKLKPK